MFGLDNECWHSCSSNWKIASLFRSRNFLPEKLLCASTKSFSTRAFGEFARSCLNRMTFPSRMTEHKQLVPHRYENLQGIIAERAPHSPVVLLFNIFLGKLTMFSIFQVQFSIQFSTLLFSFCLFFLLLGCSEAGKIKRVKYYRIFIWVFPFSFACFSWCLFCAARVLNLWFNWRGKVKNSGEWINFVVENLITDATFAELFATQMTTETSTTISSISGANINTISGATAKPQHVQKRTIHQFETDKIEVQASDHPTVPPTPLSKVRFRDTLSPPTIPRWKKFNYDRRKKSRADKVRKNKKLKRHCESENGKIMDFFLLAPRHPWRWFSFPSWWPIFSHSRRPRFVVERSGLRDTHASMECRKKRKRWESEELSRESDGAR